MPAENTMVCYENNKFKCFILRDHDTLRICTTAIEENGFTPPIYTIDTSTPNNLIFTKNEDLFNYFITLGIQINLYPIALATLKYIRIERKTISGRWFKTLFKIL